MSWEKKLPITSQCKKCPWKKSTNANDIPNGYSIERHANLIDTIADPNNPLQSLTKAQFNIMSCHCMAEAPCVGWLYNQLGDGNNMGLRIRMAKCKNVKDIKTVGLQHETFADTIPKF